MIQNVKDGQAFHAVQPGESVEACPSLHSRYAQKGRQGLASEYATGSGARHPVCSIHYALTNTWLLFDQSLTLARAPDVADLWA